MRLSFSRLDTWQQCPRKYKLRYITKATSCRASSLEFGTIVHETLERALLTLIAAQHDGPIPFDVVSEIYDEKWSHSELTDRKLYEEGLQLLDRWRARAGELTPGQVLGLETPFKLQTDAGVLSGVIDRIDMIDAETVRVIDYKTSRAFSLPDHSLQLALYGHAARQLYKAKRVQIALDLLRHDQLVVCELTEEMEQHALSWTATLAAQIANAEKYAPQLNAFCGWCDYRHNCAAFFDALEQPLHPAQLAEDLPRLDAMVKAHTQRLKELKETQRAAALHGEGSKRPAVRRSRVLPAEPAARAFGRFGVDVPLSALRVDNKAIKALIGSVSKEKQPLLKAELEAQLLIENTTTVR